MCACVFFCLWKSALKMRIALDEVSVKVEMAIKLGVDVLSRDEFVKNVYINYIQ